MAKGAYITPRIKKLVAEIYIENRRQIGPTKAREELLKKMREEGLDKIFGPDFPSVSSVSLLLKKYAKRDEERPSEEKELDNIWTFSDLKKYPIAPEAIPLVILIYDKCYQESEGSYTGGWMPSIREMLWVGRLYKIIEIYHSKRIGIIEGWGEEEREDYRLRMGYPPQWYQQIKLEDLILSWANKYAEKEIMTELTGEDYDQNKSDFDLKIDVFDEYDYRRNSFIERIAEYYGVDEDILRDPNLSPGDIERIAMETESGKAQLRKDEQLLNIENLKYVLERVKYPLDEPTKRMLRDKINSPEIVEAGLRKKIEEVLNERPHNKEG